MMRTGFRKLYVFSYFVQCTSHDFENNREMLPMETNQPLLSWRASQPLHYAHSKNRPAPVLDSNSMSRRIRRAARSVQSSLKTDILTLMKEDSINL